MKRIRTGLPYLVLLVAIAALFAATAPVASADPAPQWLAATLQGTFVGSTSSTECDQLGTAVAVSGDTALVGSQYFQDTSQDPSAYHRGQVYVYVRSNGAWAQQAILCASDIESADYFGCSVAIDGDTAVVGSQRKGGTGAAYIFTRSGGTWTQKAELAGPQASNAGWSVAISGDTVLVGAPCCPSDDGSIVCGAALVYTGSDASWTLQQKLTASDAGDADRFGWSVALSGDTAVVGAPFTNGGVPNGNGTAYVFTRSGGGWAQQDEIFGGYRANLGRSTAVTEPTGTDQTVLIGAPMDGYNMGSVKVLTDTDSGWTQLADLSAGDVTYGDLFGWSVAVSGDKALVGALRKSAAATYGGATYAFSQDTSGWTERGEMPGLTAYDQFGYALALDDDTAIVGSPDWTIGTTGSAFAYSVVISADTAAPVTTWSGVPAAWASGWVKGPVHITLNALDDISGVGSIQYEAAGATAPETYAGPFDVDVQGTQSYTCWATDLAGNVETPQAFTVHIDNLGPKTYALANVAVRAHATATFRLRVNDLTPTATACLRIYKGHVLKKTVKLGKTATGRQILHRWRCSLARGTYTWKVTAIDQAGNAQRTMTARRFTVR